MPGKPTLTNQQRWQSKQHRFPPKRRKPAPLPLPNYIVVPKPDGKGVHHINGTFAARQIGRSKGANRLHELGLAHRWTSEEARKVAKKLWSTRWRMNKHIKKRIGRPSKHRAPINHANMRARYTDNPECGIHYAAHSGRWLSGVGDDAREISERTALIRLGYLPSSHSRQGYVPRLPDGSYPIVRPTRKDPDAT